MVNSSQVEKRRNKKFIINNSVVLKQYAFSNHQKLGTGIIIINLLLIKDDTLTEENLTNSFVLSDDDQNSSLQQAISYVPLKNFWFKIVRLKIKKKYNIDIKNDYDLESKFLIIFLKDTSLEKFSIYSVKL